MFLATDDDIGLKVEKLNGENYFQWKLQMKTSHDETDTLPNGINDY